MRIAIGLLLLTGWAAPASNGCGSRADWSKGEVVTARMLEATHPAGSAAALAGCQPWEQAVAYGCCWGGGCILTCPAGDSNERRLAHMTWAAENREHLVEWIVGNRELDERHERRKAALQAGDWATVRNMDEEMDRRTR